MPKAEVPDGRLSIRNAVPTVDISEIVEPILCICFVPWMLSPGIDNIEIKWKEF
jgi:hypothetical protein